VEGIQIKAPKVYTWIDRNINEEIIFIRNKIVRVD
jgi:hypothetical protein